MYAYTNTDTNARLYHGQQINRIEKQKYNLLNEIWIRVLFLWTAYKLHNFFNAWNDFILTFTNFLLVFRIAAALLIKINAIAEEDCASNASRNAQCRS